MFGFHIPLCDGQSYVKDFAKGLWFRFKVIVMVRVMVYIRVRVSFSVRV